MAYPASVSIAAETVRTVDMLMLDLKALCTLARAESQAGTLFSSRIFQLLDRLADCEAVFTAARAVPNIGSYVQAQKGNASLDVVAEFNAVLAAITNVKDWITANFPKDANGFLLAQTFSGTLRVDRTFTVGSTATLRTQLDALIAVIG